MNNKDTEAPETVCAHCAVPIFRITGDSQSWAHLGAGQARCSILATPRVDPPAAPDEADKALAAEIVRGWIAEHFGPPPDDMQGINEDLANRLAAALAQARKDQREIDAKIVNNARFEGGTDLRELASRIRSESASKQER